VKPECFVGKTLAEIAQFTSVFWKEIRVFLLKDENDEIGTYLMDAFTVKQIIGAHPELASAVIISAYKCREETILRILAAKEEPADE